MSEKIQFKDSRPRKVVELPSFQGSEVTIVCSLTVGDMVGIDFNKIGSSETVLLISRMIEKWNFTDENGNDLPITEETVNRFPIEDITFISEQLTLFQNEVKKN